jgi:hypothetical protein
MTRKENDQRVLGAEIVDGEGQRPPRAPYEPPRILSIEALEAVAAACEPTEAYFGKDAPFGCVEAQS